jgi:hypothetical protein
VGCNGISKIKQDTNLLLKCKILGNENHWDGLQTKSREKSVLVENIYSQESGQLELLLNVQMVIF